MLFLCLWGKFVKPYDDRVLFIIVSGIEVRDTNRNLFSTRYSGVSLGWWNEKRYFWVTFDRIYERFSVLFSYTHKEDTIH